MSGEVALLALPDGEPHPSGALGRGYRTGWDSYPPGGRKRNLDAGGCWFTLAERVKGGPMTSKRDIFFGTRCRALAVGVSPQRGPIKRVPMTRNRDNFLGEPSALLRR